MDAFWRPGKIHINDSGGNLVIDRDTLDYEWYAPGFDEPLATGKCARDTAD